MDGEGMWECEGGCSEWRLMCWARACVYWRVCGMSICGLMVCGCVRKVWGGAACGKGVCVGLRMCVCIALGQCGCDGGGGMVWWC